MKVSTDGGREWPTRHHYHAAALHLSSLASRHPPRLKYALATFDDCACRRAQGLSH